MTALGDVTEAFELQSVQRSPDPLDLFLYSASVWLPHRIHYDVPHTTGVEGHPALLVQGPLQGVYLMQLLTTTFGSDIDVRSFTFRHQVPVYAGQTMLCCGRVTAVDRDSREVVFELWTELDDHQRATVAEAMVALPDRN
jgi:hydroxyacyl-ACP dehydratase HTD2-like protein with hotdog domain